MKWRRTISETDEFRVSDASGELKVDEIGPPFSYMDLSTDVILELFIIYVCITVL